MKQKNRKITDILASVDNSLYSGGKDFSQKKKQKTNNSVNAVKILIPDINAVFDCDIIKHT